MSHQIAPTSFRQGKTFLWRSNFINSSAKSEALVGSNLHLTTGIERAVYYTFKTRRFYVVKGNLSLSSKTQVLKLNLLFMPRIKVRPRGGKLGDFAEYSLLSNYNWRNSNLWVGAKQYAMARTLRTHQFRSSRKEPNINKWLSRRMLRGSSFSRLGSSKRSRLYKSLRTQTSVAESLDTQSLRSSLQQHFSKQPNASSARKSIYLRSLKKQARWENRWLLKRASKKRRLNSRQLSAEVSKVIGLPVKVKAINVFAYLAEKNLMRFKTHQEHFWNKKFRHNRYHYHNYYDLVNSFLILGIIKNSETLMLDVLRNMLETINKIKKFMFFVDAVVKNMPQIRANYTCFRMTFTGKIGGGTRRTKTYTVGYGIIPSASLTTEAFSSFVGYNHVYGAFGVKFIMCRSEGLALGIKNADRTESKHKKRPQSSVLKTLLRRYS